MATMREGQNLARARRLRANVNLPEKIASDTLRRLRHEGWPARRQHPIGRLIVDFAFASAKLVVEIDGSIHQRDSVAAGDRERDAILKAEGWTVLRLPTKIALSPDALLSHVLPVLRRLTGPLP